VTKKKTFLKEEILKIVYVGNTCKKLDFFEKKIFFIKIFLNEFSSLF